jgi:hypothetical protein
VDTLVNTATPRRPRGRNLTEYVKSEPLTALALAVAAGFTFGGGVNRRIGFALLTIIGRIAVRDVATNLIVGMAVGTSDRGKQDQINSGGGTHDDGRTNFTN